MKYVLLFFGIVLLVGGALSIYSGYNIIEVERGWASVIAGATSGRGGSITIGLALVLMSLDRLRATLEKGQARPAQQSAKPGREAAEPFSAIPDLPIAPTNVPSALSPITRERKEPVRRPVERIEPVAAPLLRDADL